jgi:hypothetical protein
MRNERNENEKSLFRDMVYMYETCHEMKLKLPLTSRDQLK